MTMKKTVLTILTISLVAVFAAFFAACEKDPPPGNDGDGDDIDTALYGKWKNSSNSLTVEFKEFKTSGNSKRIEWGGAVGSMYSDLPADKWTAKNGSISMTYQGNTTIVWYYTINGSGELVLTSPDMDKKHILFKAEEKWAWTAVADSTTWQYQKYYNDTGTAGIIAIAYGNGRWVAGSDTYRPWPFSSYNEYQAKMAYSADNGVTWTAVADSKFNFDSELSSISAIAYGNGRFVAVGSFGKMAYSDDNGATWTAVVNSTFGTSGIYGIAYGNNRFVAVGWYGKIAYSANGESWTAVSNSAIWQYPYTDTDGTTYTETAGIIAIAYGNGRFVAGGHQGKMAYSTDGATWTAVTNSTFGSYEIRGIAYGNGRWVAANSWGGGRAYSTDNGVTWTNVSGGGVAVAYGNGRFVAVGGSGMAYSSDGENWTAVSDSKFPSTDSYGNSFQIRAIAYGNNRFVAVGDDGKMAYVDW